MSAAVVRADEGIRAPENGDYGASINDAMSSTASPPADPVAKVPPASKNLLVADGTQSVSHLDFRVAKAMEHPHAPRLIQRFAIQAS